VIPRFATSRKRSLPVTARAKQILRTWIAKSKSDRVFTREDGVSPVSAFTLIQQQERMRQRLNLPGMHVSIALVTRR
jgi:hypothetical protein